MNSTTTNMTCAWTRIVMEVNNSLTESGINSDDQPVMKSTDNVTHAVMMVNSSFTDTSPWLIGIYIGTIAIIETFGNAMLLGIMHYEKFGEDSMKRTVANQLWYFLIMYLIICNVLGCPFLIYRVTIGPLGKCMK